MTARVSRRRLLPIAIAVVVLAVAAVVAFAVAVRIAGWPEIDGPPGPASAGPGASVDARIVPLLLALAGGALGLAAALALTAWVFARGLAAGYGGAAPLPRAPRRLRFALVGPALLLAVLGSFAVRWYVYVTNADTPFDEVGIGLNARAPDPLRRWGCDRLKATFGASTLPPLGCGAVGDPGRWR